MTLKIYQNKTNQIILKFEITNEILNNYDINVNNENFQELFETEILNDIFEDYNVKSNEVYYSLK
jgi:hypothetical protein